MQTVLTAASAKQQWHIFIVLLPFMVGIYLADYRNLTDLSVHFFTFLTCIGLVCLLHQSTRQMGIVLLFLTLGFQCHFYKQKPYAALKKLAFHEAKVGLFHIRQIEHKGDLQRCKGVFCVVMQKQKIALPLLCYIRASEPLKPSASYLLKCKPEAILNERYPGAFDQERFYELQGLAHRAFAEQNAIIKFKHEPRTTFIAGAEKFKKGLSHTFDRAMGTQAAAIGRALILGERDGIDARLRRYFMATGSMHILAVSGMHIGLFIMTLLKVLGLFARWISRKYALLLVLLIVWYYAFLTGMSASVLRSVFIFSVLLVSQLAGKQIGNLSGLFFSAFCLLLYDTAYLFDLGFQLSYLAMVGIYLYYDLILAYCKFRWSWLQALWSGTALGLAATLTTLPISLYHFHTYPNYAQLANLLLMTISSLVLILGMFFPFLQVLPFVDKWSAKLLEFSIELMLSIMRFFSEAPGALANGIEVPFWWVVLFWLLSYQWFYGKMQAQRLWVKWGFLFCLWWMIRHKQLLFYQHRVHFYSRENLLLFKKANHGLVICSQDKEKVAFLLESLACRHNCQIHYFQIDSGTYRFKCPQLQLVVRNEKQLTIDLKAQKQTQKIERF